MDTIFIPMLNFTAIQAAPKFIAAPAKLVSFFQRLKTNRPKFLKQPDALFLMLGFKIL